MTKFVYPLEMTRSQKRRRLQQFKNDVFQIGRFVTMFIFGICCLFSDFVDKYAMVFSIVLLPIGILYIVTELQLDDLSRVK